MSGKGGPDGAMRRVRGVLLAGCSATLSVGAHALGGGQLPHVLPTVGISVLIAWVATALAERTRGVGGILAVLGSAQLVTHLVLGELSGHVVNGELMLGCHGIATVIAAVFLARAETMLTVAVGVLSILRGLLVLLIPEPPGPPPVMRAVRPAEGGRVLTVLLRRVHPRRGPPAFS